MQEDYLKWHSPNLSADFEMLNFGRSGYPIILFPTSNGRYYQNKDFKLIEAARHFVEEGIVKIYCPDSIDAFSWYHKGMAPADRVKNHLWYEKLILEEILPRALRESFMEYEWHF